jgi:hypothetical protein
MGMMYDKNDFKKVSGLVIKLLNPSLVHIFTILQSRTELVQIAFGQECSLEVLCKARYFFCPVCPLVSLYEEQNLYYAFLVLILDLTYHSMTPFCPPPLIFLNSVCLLHSKGMKKGNSSISQKVFADFLEYVSLI